MRILIVNKFAHITGGADRHALDLANLLRARGHKVRFISTESPDNLEQEGSFVPCLVTNESRDLAPSYAAAGVAASAVWNCAAASATRRELTSFRPQVVHAHKLYPQLSAAPVAVTRHAGVPVVQTLHDYEFVSASPIDASGGHIDRNESRFSYRALNTATFIVRRALHRPAVSAWIAVSEFVAAVHCAHGIEARVMPNFVAQQPCPTTPFDERRGMVFVGRLSSEKGVQDVVEVARHLSNINITVVGGGPEASHVQRAASDLPNLFAVGSLPREQASVVINSARLVLMPSKCQEPGPLVAIEAMAAGTPIVAYRKGGLEEYIRRAGAGAVVSPSTEALVRESRRLYSDRAAWEAHSEAGLHAASNIHSPDSYVDGLEEVYASLQ